MQPVKYFLILGILFASCRSTRQQAVVPAAVNEVTLAYAVSPKAAPVETTPDEVSAEEPIEVNAGKSDVVATETNTIATSEVSKETTKKISSFTQWKEMAATGELQMTKKEVKMLNKLEKKYKGNFDQFRADTFEFTTKAKIVAGIGILGLLLAIFTGSWFGAFLFILAALGFILRYLGAIEF